MIIETKQIAFTYDRNFALRINIISTDIKLIVFRRRGGAVSDD